MQTQLSPESNFGYTFRFRYSGDLCTWAGVSYCSQLSPIPRLFASATAVLHSKDRFEKAKGRVVAITKAIRHLPRETRAKIWADYWAQGHRRPR